jgi:uncharacterized membrane protein
MSDMPPPSIPPSSPPPPGGGSYSPPPPAGSAGGSDRTLMLVLSYVGLLALVPLFIKKDDREVQWHAKNGLAIFLAYIIVVIAWAIINNFLPASIGCALSFVSCGLWIAYLVVIILGIMKALKGERFRVPGISDFADKM